MRQTYFSIGKPEFTGPIIELFTEFGETRTPESVYDIDLVPNDGKVIIAANGVRSVAEARHLLMQKRVDTAFVVVIDHRHLDELKSLASGSRRVFEGLDALRVWLSESASSIAA